MATVALPSREVSMHDLSKLYSEMQIQSALPIEDFNIEGAVTNGKHWFFFQRGNAGSGCNGIFTVTFNLQRLIGYESFELPKIGGIEASFTDAVRVEDKIYFLATAENTLTAYDDGDVLGSIIGRIDINSLKIESTQIISDRHKLEGITLYENNAHHISFLLCEDNDSDLLQSDIFKLELNK